MQFSPKFRAKIKVAFPNQAQQITASSDADLEKFMDAHCHEVTFRPEAILGAIHRVGVEGLTVELEGAIAMNELHREYTALKSQQQGESGPAISR